MKFINSFFLTHLSLLFCSLLFSTHSFAIIELTQINASKYTQQIYQACSNAKVAKSNLAKDKINKITKTKVKINRDNNKVCECIATNHVIQSKFNKTSKDAIAQLQWVIDFYNSKISQPDFEKDPYFIGGSSGVLFSFDEECIFDPTYKVTYPE
ncbi:MAG: hypothetical protein H6625_07480 [Bdellovibrionaceae bacterium]|nr:hypothetical protein [Pseudobdellovibrionaceae bacterium]